MILARLDHPAIVRVLDGGITPDGRPYIVMNRIRGRVASQLLEWGGRMR